MPKRNSFTAQKKEAPPVKKRGRGQPQHEPTAEQRNLVRALAGYGAPQDYIAGEIGVSKPTLLKHYAEELNSGVAKANSLVVESLFKTAVKGNVTAQIFWLKCRAGWREREDTNAVTVNAGSGSSIKVIAGVDLDEV